MPCNHRGEVEVIGLIPVSYPNFPYDKAGVIGGFVALDYTWVGSGAVSKILWRLGIPVLLVLVRDFTPPSMEQMDVIVSYIKTIISMGKKVVVACLGGHGRTGTVLAVWAGLNGVKNPVEYVRRVYCPRAVETPEQEEFVYKYLRERTRS